MATVERFQHELQLSCEQLERVSETLKRHQKQISQLTENRQTREPSQFAQIFWPFLLAYSESKEQPIKLACRSDSAELQKALNLPELGVPLVGDLLVVSLTLCLGLSELYQRFQGLKLSIEDLQDLFDQDGACVVTEIEDSTIFPLQLEPRATYADEQFGVIQMSTLRQLVVSPLTDFCEPSPELASKLCIAQKRDLSPKRKACSQCGKTETSHWRYWDSKVHCNTCATRKMREAKRKAKIK